MAKKKAQPQPVIGDGNLHQYSREDIENAGADARYLMENSPIIPKLLAVDIICRRIFLHVHGAMVQEINQGWDIQFPELVIQSLGMSAQEKAVAEPALPSELHQQLFETVVPVIEIFMQMENQQHGKTETETGNTPVPGGDAGPAK